MESKEKSIEECSVDESLDYLLENLKNTQYNKDAQNYFKQVVDNIKRKIKNE